MNPRNHSIVLTATVAVSLAAIALAQQFPFHRGLGDRSGRPGLSPSTPLGTVPWRYNNPGRAFLRWWDPIQSVRVELDNSAISALPIGSWTAPGVGQQPQAFLFVDTNPSDPPYEYTTTTAALNSANPTVPASGTADTFTWSFNGTTAGQSFELYLNIPLGPTDVDTNPATSALAFPQRYYVVEIDGVQGGPFVDIIDAFEEGGAYARLGVAGADVQTLFVADGSGSIRVRLYNTTPRAPDGSFLDPFADPGNELVYADAALAVLAAGGAGTYVASPVVGEISAVRPDLSAEPYPRRVYAARNEPFFAGALNRTYSLANLGSFTYNGQNVNDPTGIGRRNMVWNWPVKRPQDSSQAELDRYNVEREEWITGVGAPESRADQRVQQDNLNGGVTFSGSFVTDSALVNHIGPNYLTAQAVAVANSLVAWRPNLEDASYTIQVYIPDSDPAGALVEQAQYDIFIGAALADSILFNQATGNGWVTLPNQPTGGYSHSAITNLRVELSNGSTLGSDAGKEVFADAVRFVRQADLAAEATPLLGRTQIRLPDTSLATRDVVVVALENGRIYCMDAHGSDITNDPPQVYWVYPSEDSANDPNAVAGQDGEELIAEMPTSFDLSSALIQNVGGEDLLFVGAQNGRVYCLEMDGRGDGTTIRRWTFPDDYNPLAPTAQMQTSLLGGIDGSVAYAAPAGQPTLYVPTSQGRMYALDAAGNAASRTTTVRWQYPPAASTPLGDVDMTPALGFGNVYFGAPDAQGSGNGIVVALDQATGAVQWTATTAGAAQLAAFDTSSPVLVPGGEMIGAGPVSGIDAVAIIDPTGRFVSFNALTGAELFTTTELGSGAIGSIGFTYMTAFDGAGFPAVDTPVFVVPTADGRVTALFANGTMNTAGTRRAWGYTLEGSPLISSVAFGGQNVGTEAFSWMYIGGANGFLYAFNHDPTLGNQVITPGDAPGQQQLVENDPIDSELSQILDDSSIILLAPETYEDLQEKLNDGTLTYADLTAAEAVQAQRRHFEFGETLYILVYRMPEMTGQLANYFLQIDVDTRTENSRTRVQVRDIPAGSPPPGEEKVLLVGIPMIPSGGRGLVPGPGVIRVTARAPSLPNVASPELILNFNLANPLAVLTRNSAGTQSVGDTTDASALTVLNNGPAGTDANPGGPDPLGEFGPSLASIGDLLSHGGSGITEVSVVDRSLMAELLGGNRGLQNVRMRMGDIAWVIDTTSPTGGVFKPLQYAGFEDYPTFVPNRSLDYPDVDRDNMTVAKELFGDVANPLYNGVALRPPAISDPSRQQYRLAGPAGYDAQMTRELTDTIFTIGLDVPRFQPPSSLGYLGKQLVYVDSSRPGFEGADEEPFRTYDLGTGIAIDERIVVATPTLDLGSMPAGAGYDGGVGGSPFAPWLNGGAFSPYNSQYNSGQTQMFREFVVLNEGNVNLVNVRMAKEFLDPDGFLLDRRPLELNSPGLHELAWLDAAYHLHSDLDPRFSITPDGQNVIQKARPGDLAPTRLNTNPQRRPNRNIGVTGGALVAGFPGGDPRVGVTAPIGTPVGSFVRDIYVFENLLADPSPTNPALGPAESYTDPGLTLRFTIRESRLTNRPTIKSAPMVEEIITGAEPHVWSNMQPDGVRGPNGDLFVAWASNRVDTANQPAWVPKPRTDADAVLNDQWRIYLAGLFNSGNWVGSGPLGDLNAWNANNDRWFVQSLALPSNPTALFPLAAGETLDVTSMDFGSPTFPAGGMFEQLDPAPDDGRTAHDGRYLAYIGEAIVRDQAGTRKTIYNLILTDLKLSGSISEGDSIPLNQHLTARMSRPALVQRGQNALVFYTLYASGSGQIMWNHYNGAEWTRSRSLGLESMFESVGAPSATARAYRNQDDIGIVDLVFTGKLRGRPNSEAFLARLQVNAKTAAPEGRNPLVSFGDRIDPLTQDPATGLYWAPGIDWSLDRTALNEIDLLNGSGSILVPGTQEVDRDTGLLTYRTTLGGHVYLNAFTGSVQFSGALIPRDMRLSIRYRPTFMKVSSGLGANYRSADVVFDDRFLGVFVDPTNNRRNRLADLSYWGNELLAAPNPSAPIRWDRFLISTTRTSGDGTASTRPYMRSFRFGLNLPTSIATLSDGSVAPGLQINWGTVPASQRFFQLDPANGRVYLMSGAEDIEITLRYPAVDSAGNSLGIVEVTGTVGVIPERSEATVPIEQVGNETALSLALDPLSRNYNSTPAGGFRRPGLVWLFWTSTRAGSADVYFETIAPRFAIRPPTP